MWGVGKRLAIHFDWTPQSFEDHQDLALRSEEAETITKTQQPHRPSQFLSYTLTSATVPIPFRMW